jgi:glycosyltransferase involved in cell wall biosynthesis
MPLVVAFDLTHAQLNPTGLGRYPAELASALERRTELRLAEIVATHAPAKATIARIAQGLAREALYYPFALERASERAGADVLHVPTPALVRAGRVPLVVTVHDLLPLRMPELFTLETRWHTRAWAKFVRRATRVITPSAYTRDEVIELLGIREDRVVAIAEGADSRFSPVEVDRDRLRAELGITGRYVLSVGTLEPRKNLGTVLRVFRQVSKRVADVALVIVGGGGWRNEDFEAELGGAGIDRVHLTGFVSDERLIELYAGTACFLYPSLGEGFGLPPIEAMACGAPVVVSDRPALPEVTGDAALRAPPADVERLAEHVVRVLQEPALAARLRAAGLARAERFTWDAAAEQTARVYRQAWDEHA